MTSLAHHSFVKMNGLGNEIVIFDLRGQAGAISSEEARKAAALPGLRYDQLIALHSARRGDCEAYLSIYNRDGSQTGACGNGMRCVAEVLFRETGKRAIVLETLAGMIECRSAAPLQWTVDMGKPRFGWSDIPLAR